jgi:hypothetical protein
VAEETIRDIDASAHLMERLACRVWTRMPGRASSACVAGRSHGPQGNRAQHHHRSPARSQVADRA